MRTIFNSQTPIWLSLQQPISTPQTLLMQMKQGLNWAQSLGDAAKNGFNVLYSPLNSPMNSHRLDEPSLSYYTTLLHKRIIGQTVFDTKIFNGNRFDSKFYAHCTRNMSGSFTLFGVNAGDSKLDVTAKLPFRSGTEYMEFILTVSPNGKVHLNGLEIIEPTILAPVSRKKYPGKTTLLTTPAHSVGFWVFTAASIPECESTEPVEFVADTTTRAKTSSEKLLQTLIVETTLLDQSQMNNKNTIRRGKRHAIIKKDIDNMILKEVENNGIALDDPMDEEMRNKRNIDDLMKPARGGKLMNRIYEDIDGIKRRNMMIPYKTKLLLTPPKRSKRDVNLLGKLLEKFELKKPILNLKKPSLRLSSGLIPPIHTVHDIFVPAQNEKKLFDSIENPDLPNGEVYFEIGDQSQINDGAINSENVLPVVHSINASPNTNPFMNLYNNAAFPPQPQAEVLHPLQHGAIPTSALFGELTEVEAHSPAVTVAPHTPQLLGDKNPMQQHNIDFVIKDLQPTWLTNRDNMEKARNNLQQYYWQAVNQQAPKISSMLPNVGAFPQQNKQYVSDDGEHVLFESARRRRRRAITSKMNEEIEKRVQLNENVPLNVEPAAVDESMDLLEKLILVIESIENNNGIDAQTNFKKLEEILKKSGQSSDDSTQRSCKVLSKAVEQQCIDAKNEPQQPLLKRFFNENKVKKPNGPIKKLVDKVKSDVKKLNGRVKRSANIESHINAIPKHHESDGNSFELWNIIKNPLKPLTQNHENVPNEAKIEAAFDDATIKLTEENKGALKILKEVESSFHNILRSITKQFAHWANW